MSAAGDTGFARVGRRASERAQSWLDAQSGATVSIRLDGMFADYVPGMYSTAAKEL